MNVFKPDFFNLSLQILSRKRSAFDIEDVPGLLRVHWKLGDRTLLSTFYTRHDQSCILWSLVSASIFGAVQFSPLSWLVQATLSSGLTLFGIVGMLWLTQRWAAIEGVTSVLYCWALLMLSGMVLTDLSVFLGWGELLIHLCQLWLGLSAIGYLYTGYQMRSRAFLLMAVVHLLGIALLPYVETWQFLTTGVIIGISVLLVGELQWDASGVCGQNPMFAPAQSNPV